MELSPSGASQAWEGSAREIYKTSYVGLYLVSSNWNFLGEWNLQEKSLSRTITIHLRDTQRKECVCT